MKRSLTLLSIFLILSFLWIAPVNAQEESELQSRPVTSVYRLEIGGSKALATYLSPLHYSGTGLAASGEWSKAMPFNPEKALMQFSGRLQTRSMLNPAHTARMIGLQAEFQWGMAWRHRLPHNIQITAGGAVDINGGALYLSRNSNNPVNAMAYAGIAATASASWHFTLGRLPILVSDQIYLPTLGAFFCPEYGETYYEIYLGNRRGLTHCGWWGNRFTISNLLSFKLDFGRTAMEIGYRYSYQSEWANNLSTRLSGHYFVIGVIPQGIGLKRRSPRPTIYSLY